MRSGAHTIREVRCISCTSYIGWKIVQAHEHRERWKEGAFVLERDFLLVHSVFEEESQYQGLGCGWDELRKWRSSPALRLKVIDDLKSKNRALPSNSLSSSESDRS